MKKLAVVLIIVLLAAAGVAIGSAKLRPKDGSTGTPSTSMPPMMKMAVTVEVAEVERGPVRESVRYVGSVEAYESVVIIPKVTGILESIKVDIGDRVSKDDLIATIDDADFAQRLEQVKASLKLAEAQHERSRINLDSAGREFERTEALVRAGLVPEQQLDLAAAQRDSARADVDLAEATVNRARAALDEAKINFDNTRIAARLSGYIDKRRVDPGALVSPTTPLCDIVKTDPAKVVINVPENDVPLLEVGRPTVVKVGRGSIEYEGEIERIAPTVDVATRTTVTEIAVPNAEGKLRPGMYADVLLVVREKSDALIVPEQALVRGNGQTNVLRVEDGVAHACRVTVGILGEGWAEVLDGLQENDVVIVKGQYLVRDGERVRYASDEELTAEAT